MRINNEEELKFVTDNCHQRKKNRMYADAVVNIPDDPAVSRTTNELSKSKLDNKTVLSSVELRGIYDILISDEPKMWKPVLQFYQPTLPFMKKTVHSIGHMVQDKK